MIDFTSWRMQAACREVDPEIFFAEGTGSRTATEDARRVCAHCPVRRECAEYAIDNGVNWGVWGGMTQTQLRAVRRRYVHSSQAKTVHPKPKPREPAKCGTRSGYQRHRKNGEDACLACKQANTDADNRLRRTGTTKPPTKRPETLAEAFQWRTVRTEDGHLLWYGDKQIKFQNSKHSALRVAFTVGHGRDPVGPIRRTCGKDCYAADHLTDAVMRDARTECGTSAGYIRHVRRGEETCARCRAANAAEKARYQHTGTTKAAA